MQAVSKPAALMRAAQAIVERRARLAASSPPGSPQPSYETPRAPEQGARSFQWEATQPGRLLGSIDTATVPQATGSGYEVRHVDTGRVIAQGASASEAHANAQGVAHKLGRRRLLAWLLPDADAAPSWTRNRDVFDLYDGAIRQGSAWQTAYHNGDVIDRQAALQRYNTLQDEISAAILSPDTPDEARLPLATAGEQLFAGATIAGVADIGKMPPAMLHAAGGAMVLGGGESAAGPHITPRRTSNVLPGRAGIYEPYRGSSLAKPEQIGPRPPQSPLAEGVSYPDPNPPVYKGDMAPDTPVQDHNHARALGGHATNPDNIDTRAWAENARKGAYEGQYKESLEQLINGGLTPEEAEWVLEGELRWIQTDIHATPVDPATLEDLPSP